MTTNKYIVTGIIVAVVLGLAAVLGFQFHLGSSSTLAGSLNNQYIEQYIAPIRYNGGYNSQLPIQTSGTITALGGFNVGSSGSTLNSIIDTTCNLIGTDGSQNASSTKQYDCAVAGLTSAYKIEAQLSTTTQFVDNTAGNPGWVITYARASSTPGFATVGLANFGIAAVPSALNIGSSTAIEAFR